MIRHSALVRAGLAFLPLLAFLTLPPLLALLPFLPFLPLLPLQPTAWAQPGTTAATRAQSERIETVRVAQPAIERATPRRVVIDAVSDAKVLRPEGIAVDVRENAREVTIRPGDFVIGRWAGTVRPAVPIASADPEATATPAGYGFIGVTREGREIRFRPVIETSGLRLTGDASAFRGQLFIGLEDLNDPTAAYELPAPISLLVNAEADDISPRQVTVSHINLPFAEIAVTATNPAETLAVTVQANGTTERAMVSMPVRRPNLELTVTPRSVHGFGFESAQVTVRTTGLASPGGRVVTVSSDTGRLETTEIHLNDQGTGSTTLRSVSIGDAAVHASSPPLGAVDGTVRFAWPIAFLAAAAAGGLVGAFLGLPKQPAGKRRKGVPQALFVGVLTGLVVVALYSVGVNVLPIQPSATAGEALVFALAAVGAFTGLRL